MFSSEAASHKEYAHRGENMRRSALPVSITQRIFDCQNVQSPQSLMKNVHVFCPFPYLLPLKPNFHASCLQTVPKLPPAHWQRRLSKNNKHLKARTGALLSSQISNTSNSLNQQRSCCLPSSLQIIDHTCSQTKRN